MSYPSMMCILMTPQDVECLRANILPFVAKQGGYLEMLCLGVDAGQTGYYFAGATALVHDEDRKAAEATAEQLAHAAGNAAAEQGVAGETHAIVVQPGTLAEAVASRAQFTDLVLVPPPYGEAAHAEMAAATEAALFQGRAPVIIAAAPFAMGGNVVLAWNLTREAMTAAHKAIPLMKEARRADVLMVTQSAGKKKSTELGAPLTRWLGRHDINASLVVEVQALPRVSDTLTRHVADTEADLLIMGAYGHSRLREAILGGTTRSLLQQTQTAVFLAH